MTSQDRIWKVIRGLGDFTIEDLIVLAEERSKSTVRVYLSVLIKTGYVRKTGKLKHPHIGGPRAIYRLIKNTGPKAPVQTRCIYDPNLNALAEVKHVD